jgi:segregation and condensation protein A
LPLRPEGRWRHIVSSARASRFARSPNPWSWSIDPMTVVGSEPISDETGAAVAPLPPDAAAGFVVELDAFTGPLDLLLHLLREEQIEIADIPIARIADQFLRVIHHLGLNQAADYLDMASRLVRLKAQMLLPRGIEGEEWDDPRAELVRRLLEYQQIKEIALWMEAAVERRALRLPRGYLPPPPALPPPPLRVDLVDLLVAVERVVSGILHPVLHRVVARPLNVEGAALRIETLLQERSTLTWSDAVGPRPTIVDVLSTLLALLELARRGAAFVFQQAAFGPVVISREPPRAAD